MRLLHALVVLVALALVLAVKVQSKDASRGFNSKINWVDGDLDAAKELAKSQGKPLLALVHKTWCGACKQLKKDFTSNNAGVDRVVKASLDYIMVNLEDNEGEGIPELQPEGAAYIPRAVFFDTDGTVRPDIKAKANPQYAYFYPNAASLADVMESARSSLKKTEL